MPAADLIVTTDQYDLHGQYNIQLLVGRLCLVLTASLCNHCERIADEQCLQLVLPGDENILCCQVIRTHCDAGRYTEGSNTEAVTAHHDFLMLACKLDDVPWLDTQPDEADIFNSIHNYELTTTCVSIPASTANDIPTTPHMFLPEKLTSVKFLNRCAV